MKMKRAPSVQRFSSVLLPHVQNIQFSGEEKGHPPHPPPPPASAGNSLGAPLLSARGRRQGDVSQSSARSRQGSDVETPVAMDSPRRILSYLNQNFAQYEEGDVRGRRPVLTPTKLAPLHNDDVALQRAQRTRTFVDISESVFTHGGFDALLKEEHHKATNDDVIHLKESMASGMCLPLKTIFPGRVDRSGKSIDLTEEEWEMTGRGLKNIAKKDPQYRPQYEVLKDALLGWEDYKKHREKVILDVVINSASSGDELQKTQTLKRKEVDGLQGGQDMGISALRFDQELHRFYDRIGRKRVVEMGETELASCPEAWGTPLPGARSTPDSCSAVPSDHNATTLSKASEMSSAMSTMSYCTTSSSDDLCSTKGSIVSQLPGVTSPCSSRRRGSPELERKASGSSLQTSYLPESEVNETRFEKIALTVDLNNLLGFGTHGKVYGGVLQGVFGEAGIPTKRNVAVKKVSIPETQPGAQRKTRTREEQLKDELSIWQRLTSLCGTGAGGHIVRFYGSTYNPTSREHSLVMEHCRFGSIRDLLNRLWYAQDKNGHREAQRSVSASSSASTVRVFKRSGGISKGALEELYTLTSQDSLSASTSQAMTGNGGGSRGVGKGFSEASFASSSLSSSSSSETNELVSQLSSGITPLSGKQRTVPTLPIRCAGRIARHVLSGLAFLHAQRVIHRDVKTSNILLGGDGFVKLCDFGVSAVCGEGELRTTCVGTPGYLPPEVIQGQAYGFSADVWSFACTVVEMVSGSRPYHNLECGAVILRTVEDACPPLDGCDDPHLTAMLRQCFNKNVAERPTPQQLLSENGFVHQGTGGLFEM